MASSLSSTTVDSSSPKPQCRIAEIVQYDCDQETESSGRPRFRCWPVPRIFRLCPGRPAVEITRYVDTTEGTGAVKVPSESSRILPKGKPWRDVHRYTDDRHKNN
ncbi:hypothetical protein BC835DRAFT_1289481 [Cytidiella melzeri]|nr:hypothetical protein BC835DRAFT_1289481 [Cytidiella melzeri]